MLVGLAFGDVGMLGAGLAAFLLDDFLPKLAKGVHCLIFHEYLSDGFVGLIPLVDDGPQALDHEPLDEVTAEHEVLIAYLSLDPLQYALLLRGLAGEEVFQYREGEHLKEGVIVEYD